MITAETISCISTLERPRYVELIPNWATTLECNVPESSQFWALLWQALAAFATLCAVGVALYQTKKANETAEKAIEVAQEANLMADTHANDERYRQASRVIAWMAIDGGTRKPRIYVENASDDAIYNVVVYNEFLNSNGEWRIEIMRPRTTVDTGLVDDDCILKQAEIKSVRIGFQDSLGRSYERDPKNGGALSDIGPCWN